MARQVEDLKMNSFKTNEANIKLKKELTKVSKDLVTATEEKEIAENEYVSIFPPPFLTSLYS